MNQSRKDHERQREAEAAAAQAGPPVVLERTVYDVCQPMAPEFRPDGSAMLGFLLPSGKALHFPVSPENRKELGEMLIGGRVQIAGVDEMPGGANGNGGPAVP